MPPRNTSRVRPRYSRNKRRPSWRGVERHDRGAFDKRQIVGTRLPFEAERLLHVTDANAANERQQVDFAVHVFERDVAAREIKLRHPVQIVADSALAPSRARRKPVAFSMSPRACLLVGL